MDEDDKQRRSSVESEPEGLEMLVMKDRDDRIASAIDMISKIKFECLM